jgi:hypothetical protein
MMGEGGSIILVASAMHYMGLANHSAYAATKAALRSFARTWAAEFKDSGIRANTLSPGVVNTPMLDDQASSPEHAAEIRRGYTAYAPMLRLAQPDEIANAALFLASDESSFMTGIRHGCRRRHQQRLTKVVRADGAPPSTTNATIGDHSADRCRDGRRSQTELQRHRRCQRGRHSRYAPLLAPESMVTAATIRPSTIPESPSDRRTRSRPDRLQFFPKKKRRSRKNREASVRASVLPSRRITWKGRPRHGVCLDLEV